MRGLKSLIVLLVIAAAPALADEADIMQAAGKQLDAYTLCLKVEAHEIAQQSQDSEDAVIDQALIACGPERQDLFERLQASPLNASPETAKTAVKQLTAAMWPSMISIIEATRAE